MYIKPTLLAGGGAFESHACTHSMALASAHIASGPGVLGLSAMHVKLLLPLRMLRILPSAVISTIAASFEMAAGAADIALLMIAASSLFACPMSTGAVTDAA